ncbi:hypothetical protein EDD15DRAFT_2520596 [Pisolithus albus]|nr:hypothetical protein EDD15DRAFT_2520596 [Pisolithus albus]
MGGGHTAGGEDSPLAFEEGDATATGLLVMKSQQQTDGDMTIASEENPLRISLPSNLYCSKKRQKVEPIIWDVRKTQIIRDRGSTAAKVRVEEVPMLKSNPGSQCEHFASANIDRFSRCATHPGPTFSRYLSWSLHFCFCAFVPCLVAYQTNSTTLTCVPYRLASIVVFVHPSRHTRRYTYLRRSVDAKQWNACTYEASWTGSDCDTVTYYYVRPATLIAEANSMPTCVVHMSGTGLCVSTYIVWMWAQKFLRITAIEGVFSLVVPKLCAP